MAMVRQGLICASLAAIASSASSASTPCCDKECELPLVKYFSTDAPHGFCGEACMDPAKFDIYHKFEANLTRAKSLHPCSEQRTPDNAHNYTDYVNTVTHGFPGVLTVTLDFYKPTGMPDHSCCDTPFFAKLNCVGIPGKPKSLSPFGTGPFCCPPSATEVAPCAPEEPAAEFEGSDDECGVGGASLCSCSELMSKGLIKSFDDCTQEATIAACREQKCRHAAAAAAPAAAVTSPPSTTPCCDKACEPPLVKYFSTVAPNGFCGEACMDPTKFDTYHRFEANLTRSTSLHPCSEQRTPDNVHTYTEYVNTVTHGFPGVLTVTLDFYKPTGMPDHSCCATPLFPQMNCVGIPGKPRSLNIFGTGPFCCPRGATEAAPCAAEEEAAAGHNDSVGECDIGGTSLCTCEELLSSGRVGSLDDCTQAATMAACSEDTCRHVPETPSAMPAAAVPPSSEPCCDKECEAPLVKYFSTDAPHGFCGEACMDPAKFDIYHKFEANLTRATSPHPCSEQRTPDNTKNYTEYVNTMTHGFPGVLTVTLDFYKPTGMPDHSCCDAPLFQKLHCVGIPGKPEPLSLFGTGPFCCPQGATAERPCTSGGDDGVLII